MTRLTTEIRGHSRISESITDVCARTVSPTSEVNTKPLRHININDFNNARKPYTQTCPTPSPTKKSCRSTHAAVANPKSQLRSHHILRRFQTSTVSQLRALKRKAIAARDLYGEERNWQMAQSIQNRSAAGPQEQEWDTGEQP
jgi:hypothetical protein